jgi:hypothetical protein
MFNIFNNSYEYSSDEYSSSDEEIIDNSYLYYKSKYISENFSSDDIIEDIYYIKDFITNYYNFLFINNRIIKLFLPENFKNDDNNIFLSIKTLKNIIYIFCIKKDNTIKVIDVKIS